MACMYWSCGCVCAASHSRAFRRHSTLCLSVWGRPQPRCNIALALADAGGGLLGQLLTHTTQQRSCKALWSGWTNSGMLTSPLSPARGQASAMPVSAAIAQRCTCTACHLLRRRRRLSPPATAVLQALVSWAWVPLGSTQHTVRWWQRHCSVAAFLQFWRQGAVAAMQLGEALIALLCSLACCSTLRQHHRSTPRSDQCRRQ
jgi:hypothetical protein